jgi:hypothetical protein
MITTILEILASALVLLGAAWCAVFGGIGAWLSHARGGSPAGGLLLGALLGPLGWALVLWRSRGVAEPHLATLERGWER